MKVIDITTVYEVDNQDVTLSIIVGNAQIGTSVVKLEAKEIGRGAIDTVIVGTGPKIQGKSLKTKSVVTDVNDKTNKTSVTYRLKGGKRDQDFISAATVDAQGDAIIYRALFKLV